MRRRFAPRWHWTLLTAALLPLLAALGFWQWHRGQLRQAQWDDFARGNAPAIDASAAALERLPRYTRVRLSGRFDGEQQFLLDNISHEGAPGYQVLTVFTLPEGSRLLVNRGWLPFTGYRDRLPDLALPADAAATLTISGRLGALPVAGMAAGRMAPAVDGTWPRITSFPAYSELEAAYGMPLVPTVLLLDADSGPGYLREWTATGLPPARHIGYAVQWWALALLLLGLFITYSFKRQDAASS